MAHPCLGHASWSENEGLEQSDTCSMKDSLWREGGMLARKDGIPLGTAGEPSTRQGNTKQLERAPLMSCLALKPQQQPRLPAGWQELCQGAEGINSALSSCSEKDLPCCFTVLYACLSWEQGRDLPWDSLLGDSLIQWSCRCQIPAVKGLGWW